MLHETTQRRVCRIAFLAGCVLPTLFLLAAVARFWLPNYTQQWETPLDQLLGCRVTIDQIQTPTPGVMKFKRVVLSDPEVGTNLANFEGVTYAIRARTTRISIDRAEVNMSEGLQFGECLEQFLRKHQTHEIILVFAELELVSETTSLSLSNVRTQYISSDAGSRLQFWSPDDVAGPRLQVERNRQIEPPTTRVTFDSGTKPILCQFFAAWDCFDRLGNQAILVGQIELTYGRDSARGHLAGIISNLHPSPTLMDGKLRDRVAVDGLHWSVGRTEPPDGPSGPVAAILARFSGNEQEPVEAPAGEVTWELNPCRKRKDVANRIERQDITELNLWR